MRAADRSRSAALMLARSVVVAAALAAGLVAPPGARAAECPGAGVGGPAVAWIEVQGRRVPVKPISFRPGGALDPPASNQVAGLSRRHAPLNAKTGTSVIAWHVRYGQGCPGSLNPLLKLPIGAEFTVTERGGKPVAYRITDRVEVRKGRYRASWFRMGGPRRLALFTCAALRNGQFRNTVAVFADPVLPPPSAGNGA